MESIQYILKSGGVIEVPVFNGRTVNTISELMITGYEPISMAQIMEQRVLAFQSKDAELAQIWGNNSFVSNEYITYPSNVNINFRERKISKEDLNDYCGKYLREFEILKNPIWLQLANWDLELLKNYTRAVNLKSINPDLMKIDFSRGENTTANEQYLTLRGLNMKSNVDTKNDGLLVGVRKRLEGKLK